MQKIFDSNPNDYFDKSSKEYDSTYIDSFIKKVQQLHNESNKDVYYYIYKNSSQKEFMTVTVDGDIKTFQILNPDQIKTLFDDFLQSKTDKKEICLDDIVKYKQRLHAKFIPPDIEAVQQKLASLLSDLKKTNEEMIKKRQALQDTSLLFDENRKTLFSMLKSVCNSIVVSGDFIKRLMSFIKDNYQLVNYDFIEKNMQLISDNCQLIETANIQDITTIESTVNDIKLKQNNIGKIIEDLISNFHKIKERTILSNQNERHIMIDIPGE